jgi:hypothetical protein
MILHELDEAHGILMIRPEGRLESADFEKLAAVVDPYIEQHGGLRSLMVEAESFPGWSDFGALVSHLKFVRGHHRKIARFAAVSDGGFLKIMPEIARHFVEAELRYFDTSKKTTALAWLKGTTV